MAWLFLFHGRDGVVSSLSCGLVDSFEVVSTHRNFGFFAGGSQHPQAPPKARRSAARRRPSESKNWGANLRRVESREEFHQLQFWGVVRGCPRMDSSATMIKSFALAWVWRQEADMPNYDYGISPEIHTKYRRETLESLHGFVSLKKCGQNLAHLFEDLQCSFLVPRFAIASVRLQSQGQPPMNDPNWRFTSLPEQKTTNKSWKVHSSIQLS